MELAGGKGALVESFDSRDLRASILEAFPDLASEIDPTEESHLLVATLARAVMAALGARHDARAKSIVAFVDALLGRTDLDPDIRDAIALSFVDSDLLAVVTGGTQLWEDTPKRLRHFIEPLEPGEVE